MLSAQPVRPVKQIQTRIQPVTIQPVASATEVIELRLPKVEVVKEEREVNLKRSIIISQILIPFFEQKVYSATLAFTLAENVVQGVKHIAENLIGKNYQVKFTYTVRLFPVWCIIHRSHAMSVP